MNPVLVVSADTTDHGAWTHLLRERGYRVIVQPGIEQEDALELISDPSLVMLDIGASTPLASAWAALEWLRSQYPAAPLIMLLPTNLPETYRRMFEGNTNACLHKPLDLAMLARLVDMFVIRQAEKRRIERGISRMFSLTPA